MEGWKDGKGSGGDIFNHTDGVAIADGGSEFNFIHELFHKDYAEAPMAKLLEIFGHVWCGVSAAVKGHSAVEDFDDELSGLFLPLLYTETYFNDTVGIILVGMLYDIRACFVDREFDFPHIAFAEAELTSRVRNESPHVSQKFCFALDLQGLDCMCFLTCQGLSQCLDLESLLRVYEGFSDLFRNLLTASCSSLKIS